MCAGGFVIKMVNSLIYLFTCIIGFSVIVYFTRKGVAVPKKQNIVPESENKIVPKRKD